MKKTGIFYGSSTGVTGEIANRMAEKLGIERSDVYDISEVKAEAVIPYEFLILGSSTWGAGDLQDDWEDFLPALKKTDLNGKTVAIFGTGDSSSFSDTFCDAIGTIYTGLQRTGCAFCGSVSVDGYTFDDSTAVIDGVFAGLPLDEVNEDDMTEERLDQWVEQLKSC